jgi:hypothetical protein
VARQLAQAISTKARGQVPKPKNALEKTRHGRAFAAALRKARANTPSSSARS